MKLLPCFTTFVNDAAKAAKRISQQEFKEVADETFDRIVGYCDHGGQNVCNSSRRRI